MSLSRFVLAWALLLVCVGCRPTSTSIAAQREAHAGPLVGLVPKGPSRLLVARPKQLAESPGMRALWRTLVLEEREQAFVARTGIDLLQLTELVAFEVPPSGYVVLARGPFDAAEVVKRAGQRIAVVEVASDGPLRREGLRGDGRYAYASLDSHAVLSAKDAPPELIAAILSRSTGTRSTGPQRENALESADGHALLALHHDAPLVLLDLEPLPFEAGTPIALLFARQRSLGLAARPTENKLSLTLDLLGEFPNGAEQNFRNLVRSLQNTALVSALGLSNVADSIEVRAEAQGVRLSTTFEAQLLERALRQLVSAEMRDLVP